MKRPVPEARYHLTLRTGPSRPYQHTGRHLRLPAALPLAVSAVFSDAADRRQEAGALLYGVRGTEDGQADLVQALLVPAQMRYRTHYRIPPDSIAAASAATRARGWVTLGQVHTHPGDHVEHSRYDDRHAISSRAVSFVLPRYGRDEDDWLTCAGVHDYQDDWWHRLTAEQAAARVSFADEPLQVLDLRSQNRSIT